MQPEELETLIREHGPALRLLAAQWSETPEDCVQEGLLRLVRQRPRPDQPSAWLYRVVRNLAVSDHRSASRRRRREHEAAQTRGAWFRDPPDSPWSSEQLQRALTRLTPEQREAVVARTWGGMSFEQLAAMADCAISTAHRRYEHGLERLRQELTGTCRTTTTNTTTPMPGGIGGASQGGRLGWMP